jgi:AcrR family transcriptional regulator
MRETRKNSIRDSVIETASRLFYQQGYANTGINQIIEESGVVKSSLYQGFRSKEDILVAYLETSAAATHNALWRAAAKYDNPKDKILGIFDYLMELMQETDYNGCNFLNIVAELPKDALQLKDQIKKQKDGVRALFMGILAATNKQDLTDNIYVLFEGALIANKVHNSLWPVEKAREMAGWLLDK